MLKHVSIDQIFLSERRQRTTVDRKELEDLKASLQTTQLIQPILVHEETHVVSGTVRYWVIAGGRRYRALAELLEDKNTRIRFGNSVFDHAAVPVLVMSGADLLTLKEIEFDENVIRADISWQDRVSALEEMATLRELSDPQFTQKSFAEEIHQREGGTRTIGTVRTDVVKSLTVASALKLRPDLNKAKSVDEAYKIIVRERHEYFETERARRRLRKVAEVERLWTIHEGDLKTVMKELADGEVDLVLADPPYGQNAGTEKYSASAPHRYDDTPEYAQDLSIFILQESWRLTKPQANLFLFCRDETFMLLRDAAARYGWTPWYHPVLWYKGPLEGHSPWGRKGFFHTYETILFCTKGQKGINGPAPDILEYSKVPPALRIHGAEKPDLLYGRLLDLGSGPYDLVLDPCAGSGASILASVKRKRRAVGIELDPLYYNHSMTRLSTFDEEQVENLDDH